MPTFDDIKLFPWHQEILDLMTNTNVPIEPLTVQQLQEAQASLEQPIQESSSNIITHNGISMEYHDGLVEQMAEVQALPELVPFSSQDIASAGFVYAPYIPLMQTPTLHTSDLTVLGEEIFVVKKYNDIYSDARERFEILDL
jgi:hypothetical protein